MEEIIIRQYRKEDRSFVRDIAGETAFMGESANAFFDSREILADFLTRYFTDYEPESCFVAETNNRIIGYLIGTKNISILKRAFLIKIALGLSIRVITNATLLKKKNLIFLFHCLFSFLKGEFKMPDFSTIYPATLHINLKEDSRDLGIGSRLVSAYLDYLTKKNISGVHLATTSGKASLFFKKQGFSLLHQSSRSYFRYILHRDITVYIYGKILK